MVVTGCLLGNAFSTRKARPSSCDGRAHSQRHPCGQREMGGSRDRMAEREMGQERHMGEMDGMSGETLVKFFFCIWQERL